MFLYQSVQIIRQNTMRVSRLAFVCFEAALVASLPADIQNTLTRNFLPLPQTLPALPSQSLQPVGLSTGTALCPHHHHRLEGFAVPGSSCLSAFSYVSKCPAVLKRKWQFHCVWKGGKEMGHCWSAFIRVTSLFPACPSFRLL